MRNNLEKTDTDLKTDVLTELKYDPSVRVTDIGILVNDGTVTLNGYADSYVEKREAVRVVKRVAGVRAIADDIQIKMPDSMRRTDGDIASAAVNQLDSSTNIPKGTVHVMVSEGWITLDGEVEWGYLKNTAEDVVQHLSGVKGVSNFISIKSKVMPGEIETVIKSAFKRSALLEAVNIQVDTSGRTVILRGKVRSYGEREEAERVTWAAPGVFSVDNQLTVRCADFSDSPPEPQWLSQE